MTSIRNNADINDTSHKRGIRKQEDYKPPQELLDKLVNTFWVNNPYIKDFKKSNELEVRFGTRGIKPLTKIDYDNVICKIKSLGFTCQNEQGEYMLRVYNEFLDPATGVFRDSDIRTEINGFHDIQTYCKRNSLLEVEAGKMGNIQFFRKKNYKGANDVEAIRPINFDEFNFRVSYQTEERIGRSSRIIENLVNTWEKAKKYFRYINRVTFSHPDIPVNIDISIVKSSSIGANRKPKLAYTTEESEVFQNPEVYEIELEVNNDAIGPGTNVNTAPELLSAIRKTIKYVLMGLQETNYPISYPEQNKVLQDYMQLVNNKEYNPSQRVYPNHFIGPSSYTLQMANIAPINNNAVIPNIRNDYTVTDKADGERHMMYISNNGKIYLINTNMKVLFTGALTKNKEIFNSLIDGEIILHDKYGKFINMYAAFDAYFINNNDVRPYGFVPRKMEDDRSKFRIPLLESLIKIMKPVSVVPDEISPIRIACKQFYPSVPTDNIFDACNFILGKEVQGLFEYNTDGLIFTPASMGVGTDKIGKPSPSNKTTWKHSFKWKPPQYNTIDFLVTTIKSKTNGQDLVTPIFQDGINTASLNQLDEFKTIELRCGFDEKTHGYINPCQDVINDILPDVKNMDNENKYQPVVFVPTNPFDPNAGICNIMLKKDDTGVNQMYTEENQVFADNTIVEFRYELTNEASWRWVPLRVRYDKTGQLNQGQRNFGNAYHVANSNWHSIHNPITIDMISTGNNIPDELANDDIYYNRITSSNKTRALRDFHNLYVKQLLITRVSRRGDTLIDYACGKAGDFSKWISARLSFVFGIDVSKDNLENRLDGACARFLNYRKDFENVPYALFVNGNSSANVRSGAAMLNDKAVHITKAVFGSGVKDEEKLGKGVMRQYGKGEDGFNVSSCQFALHYFFENHQTFQNYMRNVAECTKLGGYFIGTCYDGKLIFNLLKNKKQGESIDLFDDGVKIWEINKDYSPTEFEDDASSIGYKINVYQESINKMFAEYLVNFDYLHRVMENYGFKLLARDEAKNIGLPEGSGLFSELYNYMIDEIKRNPSKKNEYGTAMNMTAYERKISFLNRYFVYKKISNVNAEKIALDFIDETAGDEIAPSVSASASTKAKTKGKEKETKPKIKKLNKRLVLIGATESPILEEELEEEKGVEPVVEEEKEVEEPIEPLSIPEPVPEPIPIAPPIPIQEKKPRKPRVLKPKLKILEE
uniref:mRNA (guanine-N(7))-methyltransferase n=1 Tax=viral metagenome TaxID=1070528 RepID=A0A6C0EWH9_9ZZZZ